MLKYKFPRSLCISLQNAMEFGKRLSSSTAARDMQRIETFTNPKVQSILKQLTGRDFNRIFRNRKIGQKLRQPKVTFMTEKQLEETIEETERKADKLLQMPPVLPPANNVEKILSFDPKIQLHDESAYVFTDISGNSTDRDRLIVIRDVDGTLRHADGEVRTKMNSIYFPFEGRTLNAPKMFSDSEVMKSVLDRASPIDNTYEFILDRACIQFDPDDPQYVSIVEATYDRIDEMLDYDLLKSTRHYGPMVFYLTRTRKMDKLLMFNIQRERISFDAVPLVSLFHLIFSESLSKQKIEASGTMDEIETLRSYIQLDSIKRQELELCLNAYEEIKRSRGNLEKGLQRAHGY